MAPPLRCACKTRPGHRCPNRAAPCPFSSRTALRAFWWTDGGRRASPTFEQGRHGLGPAAGAAFDPDLGDDRDLPVAARAIDGGLFLSDQGIPRRRDLG